MRLICHSDEMIVSEVKDSDGAIIKPDFILEEIDIPRALNRIANISEAEQWEDWEIREAVRLLMTEGAYYEKRPSYYMGRYRRGMVIAAGEKSGVSFGDIVMFSFRLSAFWGSGWRDCPRIDSGNILFLDSRSSAAVQVDSHNAIYIVPKGAALGRFQINSVLERAS